MQILRLTWKKYIFNFIPALLAGGFTYFALDYLPFYPTDYRLPLVIGLAVFWALKPALGGVLALTIFFFPILYNSLTLAIIFVLFLLVVAILEAWTLGPYGFLVLAATTVIVLQPKFSALLLLIPLLAGLLGIRRGIVLGAVSCFWAESLASLMGKPIVGLLTVKTTSAPLLSIHSKALTSLFDSGWFVAQTEGTLDTNLFENLFSPFIEDPILFAQVGLWALSAGVLAWLLTRPLDRRIPARYSAVLIGSLILGVGYLIIPSLFGEGPDPIGNILSAVFVPALLAGLASPILRMAAVAMTTPLANQLKNKEGPQNTWKDLAGIDEIRDELAEVIETRFNHKIRQDDQTQSNGRTHGVLLFGPPGTGKTKLARVIANEAEATLISVNGNDFNPKFFDVFISYSTKDKTIADSVVFTLEKNNIRCWYAPRDIKPGSDWGKAITDAIKVSKVFLLIFSSHSDHSQRVLDELNFAITQEVTILPFRTENLQPNDTLMLHLSTRHWLDAYDPSWDKYLTKLRATILLNLERGQTEEDVDHLEAKKKPVPTAVLAAPGKDLRQLLDEAREKKPSVLFFDELEAFIPKRKNDPEEDNLAGSIPNPFLACLDEIVQEDGILVVGASHHPGMIDPSALEPGRFDKLIYLKPPGLESRIRILERYLWDQPLAWNVDLRKLAGQMDKFTGFDIQEVCVEAVDLLNHRDNSQKNSISMGDLEMIINSKKPSFSPNLRQECENFAGQYQLIMPEPE